MTVESAIQEYLFAIGGRSKDTKCLTKYVLLEFEAWCQESNIELEQIKVGEMKRYADYLRIRPARTGKRLSSQS